MLFSCSDLTDINMQVELIIVWGGPSPYVKNRVPTTCDLSLSSKRSKDTKERTDENRIL